MLEFTSGDMFEARAQIRVNTVNCVGVMGAGVALAFKRRYPDMFKDYQRECRNGRIKPGKVHVWKSLAGDWIVNFPTKRDWREPSRYEDIDAGLDDLRAYLNTVGPVTVALPALGCGNGGLDWTRVSAMIREKLADVDAHVLVFEPAASHQAGRAAVAAPTDDELRGVEKLGYRLVGSDGNLTPGSSPAYVLGNEELLSRKWIALLPSRAPAERELQALSAIATQLARSKKGAVIALVYATRVSEDVAQLFASQGVETVLLLPFGVLTRKPVAKQPDPVVLTLASSSPPNSKWSRHLFAQTMDMLRSNSVAMLLSDPEPDWLTSSGLGKWAQIPTSYIRYESTPAHLREALADVGAKPISRRGEDGSPRIDHLGDTFDRDGVSEAAGSKATSQPQMASVLGADQALAAGNSVLAISLGRLPKRLKQELFEALMRVDANGLDVTVRLPKEVTDADLLRLIKLGFSPKGHG